MELFNLSATSDAEAPLFDRDQTSFCFGLSGEMDDISKPPTTKHLSIFNYLKRFKNLVVHTPKLRHFREDDTSFSLSAPYLAPNRGAGSTVRTKNTSNKLYD